LKQTSVLLVNVGTPDSHSLKDVRRYLSQFLNDRRVITLPAVLRKILVNGIIIPFRTRKSSKLYKQLWTEKGSPLLYYSQELVLKLQQELGESFKVCLAMRYGNPSLDNVLNKAKATNPDEIIIVPLYPQYASSTTGSVFEAIMNKIKHWEIIPGIKLINQFYGQPEFIKAFKNQIESYNPDKYDHILFSYHGLPLDHIKQVHPSEQIEECTCINEMTAHGKFCYRAVCYETTRLLVKELNISSNRFSVGFQSRLSKNWLTPFSDEVVKELAEKGVKKLLVVAPSFVTDCLETIIEIQEEYHELFLSNGGEELTLVKSLNSNDIWSQALAKIIQV